MGFFNKLKAQALEKAKEEIAKSLGDDAATMLNSMTGSGGGGGGQQMSTEEYENTKPDELKKDIRMISGCRDNQTSADVSNVSSFQLPDPAGEFVCSLWAVVVLCTGIFYFMDNMLYKLSIMYDTRNLLMYVLTYFLHLL